MNKRLVPIGKAVAPQGIKGELRLLPYFDGLKYFKKIERVYLLKSDEVNDGEEGREFALKGIRPHGKFLVMGLEGCDRMDDARELVDMEVHIEAEDLIDLPEDEFYWHQLKGLNVYTSDGRHLGRLADNFSAAGSNEVLVVRKDGKELLLPALKSLFNEVDLEGGKLIINPMNGLLDDYEI